MSRLEELRNKIDAIDESIIEKLAQREKIIHEVKKFKEISGVEIFDEEREKKLMHLYEKLSESYNIDQKFIKKIFADIHSHSKTLQK